MPFGKFNQVHTDMKLFFFIYKFGKFFGLTPMYLPDHGTCKRIIWACVIVVLVVSNSVLNITFLYERFQENFQGKVKLPIFLDQLGGFLDLVFVNNCLLTAVLKSEDWLKLFKELAIAENRLNKIYSRKVKKCYKYHIFFFVGILLFVSLHLAQHMIYKYSINKDFGAIYTGYRLCSFYQFLTVNLISSVLNVLKMRYNILKNILIHDVHQILQGQNKDKSFTYIYLLYKNYHNIIKYFNGIFGWSLFLIFFSFCSLALNVVTYFLFIKTETMLGVFIIAELLVITPNMVSITFFL